MREIKFRGKSKLTKTWIYGDLVHNAFDGFYIVDVAIKPDRCFPIEVDPETVGQLTGVKGKNGEDVNEGDLIKYQGDTKLQVFNNDKAVNSPYWEMRKVIFLDGAFKEIIISQLNSYFGDLPSESKHFFHPEKYGEVIGNTIDNPDLLP